MMTTTNNPQFSHFEGRLTTYAHTLWREVLAEGASVCDATAGNGYDTAILSRLVGPRGHVYAVDLQAEALEQTRFHLRRQGLYYQVTFLPGNHAILKELLPASARARLALVCFNLGYLPGSDHACKTEIEHTLPALRTSRELIVPGGHLSVIAYRAHDDCREFNAVLDEFTHHFAPKWTIQIFTTGTDNNPGPVLFWARKD